MLNQINHRPAPVDQVAGGTVVGEEKRLQEAVEFPKLLVLMVDMDGYGGWGFHWVSWG